jgi:hypothetical protein
LSEENLLAILGSIPNYRSSKFQSALPPTLRAELLSISFLDIKGTVEFMADRNGGL